jgi:hypothetical protein
LLEEQALEAETARSGAREAKLSGKLRVLW